MHLDREENEGKPRDEDEDVLGQQEACEGLEGECEDV